MYIRESHIYSGPWKQESTDNCIADNLLAQISCTFSNLLLGPIGPKSQGYLGPMKHKSPVYLQISGTFRAYEAQITCIFANLILIQGLGSKNLPIIANLLDDCRSLR